MTLSSFILVESESFKFLYKKLMNFVAVSLSCDFFRSTISTWGNVVIVAVLCVALISSAGALVW